MTRTVVQRNGFDIAVGCAPNLPTPIKKSLFPADFLKIHVSGKVSLLTKAVASFDLRKKLRRSFFVLCLLGTTKGVAKHPDLCVSMWLYIEGCR
jgi:hypothetical protein